MVRPILSSGQRLFCDPPFFLHSLLPLSARPQVLNCQCDRTGRDFSPSGRWGFALREGTGALGFPDPRGPTALARLLCWQDGGGEGGARHARTALRPPGFSCHWGPLDAAAGLLPEAEADEQPPGPLRPRKKEQALRASPGVHCRWTGAVGSGESSLGIQLQALAPARPVCGRSTRSQAHSCTTLPLMLTGWVTWGKFLSLLEPPFPCLENEDDRMCFYHGCEN